MSAVYIELLGLLGFPLAVYFLLSVKRTANRGWYLQKDFRTVVSEFERPRLFAINQLVEKAAAVVCFAFGLFAAWKLLIRFSIL